MPLIADIIGFWAEHPVLVIGCLLLLIAIVLVFRDAPLSQMRCHIVRGAAAIGLVLIAAELPGLLKVHLEQGTQFTLSAAGALAVFAVVCFVAR